MIPSFITRGGLFLFCVLQLLHLASNAQGRRPYVWEEDVEENTTVLGKVIDGQNAALPFVNVAFYQLRDSSLSAGTTSDESGRFRIELPEGEYFTRLTFLSYQGLSLPSMKLSGGEKDLGILVMTLDAEQLDAVTIEAEKAEMELHMDKRVFNVEQNMVSRGSNAAQLLDNLPSVTVDVEGNVSLRGSQNVRILVDGRPSGLVGFSSTEALRQLQSSQVERVEVITNPSARYDAEGEVGIINIVLKEEKRTGFNGSFELRTGEPANHGASANLNYRTQKSTFFGSYGAFYRRRPGTGASEQSFTYPDTSFSYDRQEEHNRGGWNQMARAGVDHKLAEKASISLSGLYRRSDGDHYTELDYLDYNEEGDLVRSVKRREDETDYDETKEVNVNFEKKYAQKDRKWTIDLKYMLSGEVEEAFIEERSPEIGYVELDQRTFADELQELYFFQSDYIHPVGKAGKFETGVRGSIKTLDLKFTLENQLTDESWEIDNRFNNFLIYKEDIYAAYAMYGNKHHNWSYQLGLRAEYSNISTELVETGDFNPRDYLNLFPSAHFSYELKKKTFLQFSYSRRIRRPNHWWLVPFFGFSDNRNFRSGNPDLDPQYIHSMETTLLKRNRKGSIMGSIYYRHTDNNMERIIFSDDNGFTRSLPVNLGQGNSIGLESNANLRLKKWWTVSANWNGFYETARGTYEDVLYTNETFAWTGRFNTKWNLKKLYSLQSNFNYRSAANTNQGRRLPLYSWDAAASIDVLNSKGTLSFNARDILNSRKRRDIVEGANFRTESSRQWMSRSFTLTFNYRINQQKERQASGKGDFDGGMDE